MGVRKSDGLATHNWSWPRRAVSMGPTATATGSRHHAWGVGLLAQHAFDVPEKKTG